MFKNIVSILIALTGTTAIASGIKVTSFQFLQNGSHLSAAAEICGELEVLTAIPAMIKIVSDPSSKKPATYYAWTGKDGKFCSVIATYTGKAEADLE